jgi:hypothetical protein
MENEVSKVKEVSSNLKSNILSRLRNGFILPLFTILIFTFQLLNLIEILKFFVAWLNLGDNAEQNRSIQRTTVDLFIFLKWLFVLLIWYYSISHLVLTILVWYSIATNLLTYFYYHIWTDEALTTNSIFDLPRIRRRFVNLFLAVAYSIICFAYLYQIPYINEFNWVEKTPSMVYSLVFSFSNSLAANYDAVKPATDFGYAISHIQLVITFIFVTIILSKSVPQIEANT